jgi:osmotically-inducible protein OsmY
MIPILPRGLLLAVLAAAAAAALGGCAPIIVGTAVVGTAMVATDRRTTGAQLEDEVIQGKAKNRIQEALGDRAQLVVTSFNRVLLLTGEAADAADKAKAEQAVRTVENVQSVVNEITIGFPRSVSQRSNDAYLTTKVKASLVDAHDLLANSIKVETTGGVVYLMGLVTQREADRAADVARGVSGVQKVVKVFEVISEAELARIAPKTSS